MNKKVFTLIELCVVIAVISILAAIFLPTFAGVSKSAPALAVTASSAQTTPRTSFAKATGKKLIEYGWDQFYAPDPTFIRDNIREMEKRPFEGIAFRLPSQHSHVFEVKNWKEDKAEQEKQLKVVSSIKWDKFTDNFLTIYAVADMDWYSDEDWNKVLSKVQFNVRAARAAGCVGILFDPEPYGSNPWDYSKQKHMAQHDFAAYSAKLYQRGQEFMRVIEKEMPDVKLLMLRQFSEMYLVAHNPDPAKRFSAFQNFAKNGFIYGMLLPFMNGMLDVAGPKVQLIDGNENSYGYITSEDFFKSLWRMRQGSLVNIPDVLKDKFRHNVRAGQAVYMDFIFSSRFGYAGMTDEERLQWFESNLYYAFQTTEEYVWLYNERMDWYNHPVLPGDNARLKEWKSVPLPAGSENAIIAAKAKLESGQDLGFSMNTVLDNYKKRQAEKPAQ